MQRLLIYGFGGGWGHLNRTLALGRIAAKESQVTILTNSPYAHYLQKLEGVNCQLVIIDPQASFLESCQQVQEVITQTNYDALVVDTFPRGLGGELAEILPNCPIPKVLIHRDLNPRYLQEKAVIPFVENHYDLILIPGEGETSPLARLPQVKHTPPWLIRNNNELLSRSTIDTELGLTDAEVEQKLVLVIASGNTEELEFYGTVTRLIRQQYPHLTVRCISPVLPPHCPQQNWRFYYPILECLGRSAIAIGSGGYNTVYECVAVDLPLLAIPWPRLYDRQGLRIQKLQAVAKVYPVFQMREILAKLADIPTPSGVIPDYPNGVYEAVRLIQQLIPHRSRILE